MSIIVATWNAARTLERCIDSIRVQQFTEWELLIADGESTDQTVDIIRRHQSTVAWWQTKKDAGIYDAWNQALPHAQGNYICFLGADDFFASSTSLAELFEAIGDEQYDLVTSRGIIFNPDTDKEYQFGSAWNYNRIGRRMVVCHPGLLHHHSLFQSHGSFDSSYRIAADLEFLLRLPSTVSTLDVPKVSVRIEAGGVSRKNVLKRLAEQRAILASCERYGPFRARLVWLDKLWRYPIARWLDISH
ncbi:glycosyltransferase family 2 protein [Dyella kyungheensis]|uniref:glycosyltransferase family 2 protein n=1 Tax=Dyella kyungheensis TaxID=1242174 RepID=UPI003CF57992